MNSFSFNCPGSLPNNTWYQMATETRCIYKIGGEYNTFKQPILQKELFRRRLRRNYSRRG